VVPILVDEARTFGMEGLFRQIGIYNPKGQQYTPVDKDQVMYYKEGRPDPAGRHQRSRRHGQLDRAATSYSTNNRIMVPFYVYYSMFGFQRIGDLAWAAGDMQARGFLLGGTSGAPRSTAKACSTKTATATSWPAPSPTASATTRPSRTKWA
jgi:pyruvate dehydrogenase E1 component